MYKVVRLCANADHKVSRLKSFWPERLLNSSDSKDITAPSVPWAVSFNLTFTIKAFLSSN